LILPADADWVKTLSAEAKVKVVVASIFRARNWVTGQK
jgi:hypothetical protein